MVFKTHSVGSGCRREARQRLRVIQAYDLETRFCKCWSAEQSDQWEKTRGQMTKSISMPIAPGCWVIKSHRTWKNLATGGALGEELSRKINC